MQIRILSLAIAASFSINALAQTQQYDLLQEQARQQQKHGVIYRENSALTRSPRIDNTKEVYLTPVLGTPQFFWANASTEPFTVRANKHTTTAQLNRQAGKHYIRQYSDILGLKGTKERELKFRSASQTDGSKAIVISYDQYVNGIPVLGGGVNLLMDKNRQLISVGASIAPKTRAIDSEQEFRLDQRKAIAIAIEDLTDANVSSHDLRQSDQINHYKLTRNANEWRLSKDAVVEKVFYPQKGHVLSAYRISVRVVTAGTSRTPGEVRHFGYVVSATNGAILQRKNYSHAAFHGNNTDFSYLVYADHDSKLPQDGPDGNNGSPHPTGQPDGFQAPFGTQNLLKMSHAGIHTGDPWLPADATETVGNNVDAYIDAAAPDGFTADTQDMRAKVNGNKQFSFVFDPSKDANADNIQKQAAVTNLFYTINYLHDVFYNAGFDEASGNAQLNNYGRGGVEGDPILAEGQDYSGLNNANMSTPPDGQSPVMQQYLFQGSPKLTLNFDGGKSYELANYANSLGKNDFDTGGSVAFVAPDNDTQNICLPFTNGSSFTGKVVVANHHSDCDSQTLYQALSNINPAVVMLINSDTLPRTFEQPLPYGFMDIDYDRSDKDFIKDVVAGNVNGHVAVKSEMFRDSTLSNLVVMHEWGHYLHGRLAGNGTGPGNNVYGGGMGEGFSDFIALMHQVREEDLNKPNGQDYNGVYAQGGWADGSLTKDDNQAYYFGIRRVPYTTDMSKNALTYRHFRLGEELPTNHPLATTDTTVTEMGPHSQGEIWATVLFEAFIGLARDKERLTLDDAKARMRQYLVSGLKLTPADATYLVARDAIIASAVANDAKDAKIIAQAFAKRGMGSGATSPAADSTDLSIGLTESYDITPIAQAKAMAIAEITKQCDADNVWDPTEITEFDITVANSGVETLPAGNLTISSTSKVTFVDGTSIAHQALEPFAQQQIKVKVKLNEDAAYNEDIVLSLASAEKPDLKVDFNFQSNYDIGLSNKETFERSVDNEAEKRFSNWTNTRERENFDLEYDAWYGDYSREANSNDARIWPYGSDLDESLESPELTVSDNADFQWSFEHFYQTRTGFAGGILEIKEANGSWIAIDGSKITRFNIDGTELGTGYDSSVDSNAGTNVDGKNAFTDTNAMEDDNSGGMLRKVLVNLGREYAGKKVQVRFRFFSAPLDGEANDTWRIDNVEFSGTSNKAFDKSVIENAKLCQDNIAPKLTLSSTAGSFVNNVLSVTAKTGTSLVLKANATDENNDSLTYKWEQVSGVNLTLKNSNNASLTIDVPKKAKAGVAKLKVTVSDGKESVTSNAMITIEKKKSGGGFGILLVLGLLGVRFMRR